MHVRPAFPRVVSGELLDALDEADPRAVHARKDLIRINRIMGAARILATELAKVEAPPHRIVELGAGDGNLMLQVARRLAPRWKGVQVVLLDRQNLVSPATKQGFAQLGWEVQTLQRDVEDWIADAEGERFDIALANLFIHHFDTRDVRRLLRALSERTGVFVASEPRRTRTALLASRLVGLIGANDVTRTDAVLSVRAGFRDQELSALWPRNDQGWLLDERTAGPFGHLFVARRSE